MQIAILGTGGIALGYAAFLDQAGHTPVLYSLTGNSTPLLNGKTIKATGQLDHSFEVTCLSDMGAVIDDAEAVIIATSVNQHAEMFEKLAPVVSEHQRILVSGELSLSADYLASLLEGLGKSNPITTLSSTILTGRRINDEEAKIGILRKVCKAISIAGADQEAELAFWQGLFGEVVQPAPSRLWVAFSNLNPTVHVGNAMLNFTRIEKGEDWGNFAGITAGVGRLTEALDNERCAIAAAYGVEVTPLLEQYQANLGFEPGTHLAEMAAVQNVKRGGLPKGPTDPSTRYVTEDVPFGICFMERLAQAMGVTTPLHRAAIDLFSAIYSRDFRAENTLQSN